MPYRTPRPNWTFRTQRRKWAIWTSRTARTKWAIWT